MVKGLGIMQERELVASGAGMAGWRGHICLSLVEMFESYTTYKCNSDKNEIKTESEKKKKKPESVPTHPLRSGNSVHDPGMTCKQTGLRIHLLSLSLRICL